MELCSIVNNLQPYRFDYTKTCDIDSNNDCQRWHQDGDSAGAGLEESNQIMVVGPEGLSSLDRCLEWGWPGFEDSTCQLELDYDHCSAGIHHNWQVRSAIIGFVMARQYL